MEVRTRTAPAAKTRRRVGGWPRRKDAVTPIRIATIYVLFGAIWILFSDSALHALVHDPEIENRLQTVKGWFYVFVTGTLVYLLARQMVHALKAENAERRRAEAALQKALAEAERANHAKSEFLATMSHEFRTPLNAILGFSDMIKAQYHGPIGVQAYDEYVDDIRRSGILMLALVNDLLDISEIEAGKRRLKLEEVNLAPLLEGCVKTFLPQATEKNLTLRLSQPAAAPPLWADHLSVIQVVSNLLSNAVKYTPAGGRIEVTAAAAEGGTTITVSDNGIGMHPSLIPIVTDPFTRAPANPHVSREGKGLGLAIVKSLVESHDGRLTIDSTQGQGTRVTVFFPAAPSAVIVDGSG